MSAGRGGRALTWLCVVALALLAAATVVAQLGRVAWLAELATHFRLQYLVGAALLVVCFLSVKRRGMALAALLLAVPNAWYVGPYLVRTFQPESPVSASDDEALLVSLNLHYRNREGSRVLEYLQRKQPDVLVLTELTPYWVTMLRPFTATYPYWMSLDRRSPWGLGVFSRYPLENARSSGLGVRGSVNVLTTVALPGGPLQLVAAHLSSPGRPARAAQRNAQLANLAVLVEDMAGAADGPPRRLVVGDLNITPYSPYLRDFLERTGLRDARRSVAGTWPTWFPPLQIQIDHCLADPAARVLRVTHGPDVGSDHYPLEVRLQ